MKYRLLLVLLTFGTTFWTHGQVAGVDWLTTMTTVSGFVNQDNGGSTGDMLVRPDSKSVIILGNNPVFSSSAVYFTEDDSLSVGMFMASYHAGSGELQWLKKFAEGGSVRPEVLQVDDEGNLYVLGDFRYMRYGSDSLVSGLDNDMFVAKHDSVGNVLWVKQMGSASSSVFQYDDRSIAMKVSGDEVQMLVRTHGTFSYADSVVSVTSADYNVLLKVSAFDGVLLSHATLGGSFSASDLVVSQEGALFTYCFSPLSSVNGALIEEIPGTAGQLIKFNENLELERIVNLNLTPAQNPLLTVHDNHIVLGGTIGSDYNSVLVDGVGVHGLDNLESRWLMLCFDKDGNFVWASDERTFSWLWTDILVRSTGNEIFALSKGGETSIYDSNGNHLSTQVLTTGSTGYRNAFADTTSGSFYLHSNYRGDATVLDVDLSSTGGTSDLFLTKLNYNRPNSVSSISQPAGLHVYPNPTNSVVTITMAKPNPQHQPSVNLYDVHGRLLQVPTTVNATQVQLDMTNLPSGIYFGQLVVGDPSTRSGQGFKVVRE